MKGMHMRNFVSKHDYNRASVHLDRSKEPQVLVEDGLLDYDEELRERASEGAYDENDAWVQYRRRMDEVVLARNKDNHTGDAPPDKMTDKELFEYLYLCNLTPSPESN